MSNANYEYRRLVGDIAAGGDLVDSRCGPARSLIDAEPVQFSDTPLVTLRRTAWRLALREMEWFLSGNPECPPELMGWWRGQLDQSDHYIGGYGDQLRRSGAWPRIMFDQINGLIDGIRTHPHSRRLIATTWNPYDMSHMTYANDNPATPTTCHGTIIQCFVRAGALHLTTYQRSADVLLGVPHNWIQYWALLMWLAYHTGLEVGTLRWLFGDAHLYQHPTHLEVAKAIMDQQIIETDGPRLVYIPESGIQKDPVFQSHEFKMDRAIPDPITDIRPVLLVG